MKNLTGLAILLIVLSLLVGGAFVYLAFPREVLKTTTITKEVPVEVRVDVPVEKLITLDYKQNAVDALITEIARDKDLRECGNDDYDEEEIAVKRIYEGFTLTENDDGDTETSDVRVKLSYDKECYRTLTCGLDIENDLSCED